MTDRELLELAAKAAGIEHAEDRFDCGVSLTNPNGGHRSLPRWNPLTDDGDCFRLAVELGLFVQINSGSASAIACKWRDECWYEYASDYAGNMNVTARRAVVRAAAEIGKYKNERENSAVTR